MPSLTRAEAERRAGLVSVARTTVDLDLDTGPRTFRSRTRIAFTATEPGASTFVDVRPEALHGLVLNGAPLDPAEAVRAGRVELVDLAAENVLTVDATMAYSHDGQGLHRASDPADGEDYVYGHLFLDAAPTVFACFDQPDLKGRYVVTVTAPRGWSVLGNGAARETAPGRWTLAETEPLPTYAVTVCAGPYVSVRDEHDGIPLGIHARASLAGPLREQAAQMFEVTRAGFDAYHRLFDIRYPFGQYHQVFVPEFNAGAMENPGCVTIRDGYLFRGAATHDEVLTRTNTIVHEMAHMWFGDLVTMRWWDDLWLNESFAEYMAHRVCVEATEFTDAWVDATMARKMWGYAAERTPSTHPVAGSPAPDAASALANFDGISYAKGAAVLRQLIAHIGDAAFVAGVTTYLRAHAYGNGTLADFLGAMEAASGADLRPWSRAWLETAGLDTITADAATGIVTRTPPADLPADRPHTLDVAGFTGGVETFRVPVTLTDDEQVVPGLAAAPRAALVVPNAGDLTWATTSLDEVTVAALAEELPVVPDAQARAVTWVALVDGVARAEVDPRALVATFAAAWPVEENESVLTRVAGQLVGRVLPCFLGPADRESARASAAAAAACVLDSSPPGGGRALVGARVLARTTDDVDLLSRWAEGRGLPPALAEDSDLRWLVVRGLARLDAIDPAGIERHRSRDDSIPGRLGALTARAVLPRTEEKEWAWAALTTDRDRSNHELNALAAGFWSAEAGLVRPWVSRAFTELPALGAWVGEDALARVVRLGYPSTVVEPATLAESRAALGRADLSPGVRRSMVDAQSELEEALRSRTRYPG